MESSASSLIPQKTSPATGHRHTQLRAGLDRPVFLPGGSDSELLFKGHGESR